MGRLGGLGIGGERIGYVHAGTSYLGCLGHDCFLQGGVGVGGTGIGSPDTEATGGVGCGCGIRLFPILS